MANSKIQKPVMLYEDYVEIPYTVTANGNYNTNLKPIIDQKMPAGCKCLGTTGFTTGNVNVFPVGIRYANNNYSFQIRNISNSQWSETAIVWFLYSN